MMVNAKGGSSEKWGLGLLVLFLDDDKSFNSKKKKTPSLMTRAQSTISICALIVIFTILLFTLSTSDPNSLSPSHLEISFPRRWLGQNPKPHFQNTHKNNNNRSSSWLLKKKKNKWKLITHDTHFNKNVSFALQGMGALFRRGNRAMTELLVAHLTENTTEDDFRLFLRTLHRSGLTARADVVFIFPSSPTSSSLHFSTIIQQEDHSFNKLLLHHTKNNTTKPSTPFPSVTHFNPSLFKNNRSGEPLWGYRNHSNSTNGEKDELGGLSWGSVVGFEASELDPEDSLAGFLDRASMQLRRWACYQMLLGRLRRNFKQVLLVDVNNIWVVGDVFSRVRTRSSETMHLWIQPDEKSNKDRNFKDSKLSATAAIVMGGIRSVRRLSNAVLMEIVRVATQRKSKNRISDSAILTHLLWNTSLAKKVKIALQSLPNPNPILPGNNAFGFSSERDFFARRGDFDGNLTALLVREICSSSSSSSFSSVDSFVYRDC
ncbi:hypothetical protein MRB53_031239 [Persea americana]|uniref:Uncharacterized protein n=1 Tax=Persea americana TaxID=3435 RepID=A0ACC2KNI7_PERAE|nr:hypothetical protein MRB53_031239 [Persea americana]